MKDIEIVSLYTAKRFEHIQKILDSCNRIEQLSFLPHYVEDQKRIIEHTVNKFQPHGYFKRMSYRLQCQDIINKYVNIFWDSFTEKINNL